MDDLKAMQEAMFARARVRSASMTAGDAIGGAGGGEAGGGGGPAAGGGGGAP